MVSAPFSVPVTDRVMLPRQACNKTISQLQSSFTVSFAIALACLTFVTVLVPERPNQLASICEKYNSVNACQVW